MPRVLVSDAIATDGIELLKKVADVDVKIGISKEDLINIIGEYDALAVRSETKVTADVIARADKLKIIGRAGVGVDNIDVEAATKRGILVVNSPEGNTIAAAEHTVAMLLAMSRNIAQADASLRGGEWKRSKFVGTEIYKKTLGVIGLGKIGREVARRLQAFEMHVLGYDPFLKPEQAEELGIRLVDLDTIYREADYITVHVPKTKETAGMIGDAQIALMKPTVRLINVARGGIYDEAAVAAAAKGGRIAGAAFDVFSVEPAPADNPLLGIPNILATPHLGASTEEAQVNVAIDISEQIVDVLQGKPARAAVNMPSVSAEILARIEPYLLLAEKIGSLQSQITATGVRSVEVLYAGDFGDLPTVHITRAVMKGVLEPVVPDSVNYVNAPTLAAARGIKVTESRTVSSDGHGCLLTVKAQTATTVRTICGTVFGPHDVRIVHIDGYRVDIPPRGHMLLTKHTDKPGMIGHVGTLLGNHEINIAGMHLGREGAGENALMVLLLDEAIPDDVMNQIVKIPGMETARLVKL